jgi:hypothetical protein
MVKRRKFLIGAGSVFAGGAAATGTGAFSQMSSGDRGVSVEVASDADAYTAITPYTDDEGDYGPNAIYAGAEPNGSFSPEGESFEERDTLELDFSDANSSYFSFGGDGVNKGSVYEFHNVFQIMNRGSQDVYWWLTKSNLPGVYFYGDKSGDADDPSQSILGKSNALDTSVGFQKLAVGVKIVADELNVNSLGSLSGSIQVHGQASTDYTGN